MQILGNTILTICRNGSKINGECQCNLNTEDKSVTLVYVDGTKGWKIVQDQLNINRSHFIMQQVEQITTCGDFKIHTFTVRWNF